MSLPSDVIHVHRDFNYEKLIDMKADQLDSLVKECEINCERIRGEILKNYESAQPYLMQMRLLKHQLKNNGPCTGRVIYYDAFSLRKK